jgi:hypothetical protein
VEVSEIPADGWKELNYPVISEEGDVENVNRNTNVTEKEPELDLSNVNITLGYSAGKAACSELFITLSKALRLPLSYANL